MINRLKNIIAFFLVAATAIVSSGFLPHVLTPSLAQASSTPCVGANCIELDSSTQYQTMEGWQGTAEAGQNEFPTQFAQYKDELFDELVNNLGINSLRVEVYSGNENPTDYFLQYRAGTINEATYTSHFYDIINDNGDANTINGSGFSFGKVDSQVNEVALPMKTLLEAKGETLHLTFCYVDFGSSTFEHKTSPSEYAEFVLATYQHMQNTFGFVPYSWEVILEPDNGSASWSATQVANAIKAAGDKLVANGFTPRFVAPSVMDLTTADSYITQIQNTPGAVAYMDSYSYHLYGFQDDSLRADVADDGNADGVNTSMLEYIGADEAQLRRDIQYGQVSSWQQYTLTYPTTFGTDDGGAYYTILSSDPNSLTIGSRTKKLRQYFKYIRRGAVRIATTDSGNPFISGATTAYVNSNGKYVVVVPNSDVTSYGVNDLPAGTYGIYYTTDGGVTTTLPNQTIPTGGSVNVSSIPAGVLTIYDTALDSAPSDTTPPSFTINNGTAAGPVQSDTINVTLTDASSISSSQYGFSSDNTCNGSDTYSTTFTTGVDFAITGDHTNYLCLKAVDSAANTGYQLVGQLNTDNTVPVRSAGSPTGAQAAGTTNVSLTLTTNETATCKYGTISGTAYASIASTFSTTNSTSHSQNISGLSNGNSYTYYVRCRDVATNTNTDDYTITFNISNPAPDTTDPTVSITAPTNGATVSGSSVSVTANASDNIGVVGVQFKLDGSNLGSEDTTSTYGITWDTTGTSDGSHTLTAVARDAAGNTTTSSPIIVTVDNSGPTFTINNSVAAGPVQSDTINITVSDATSVSSSNYGFSSDNTCNGSDTYGTSFTTNVDFAIAGNHTDYLCVRAIDSLGNTRYQLVGQLNTDNTAPTVSITAPTASATVSGSAVSVTANAADGTGVVGVQFKLDGSNLGSEDTTSTYGITWDTTGTSNGSHSLTAVARDAAGNTTTSSAVVVTVDNTLPIVANPNIDPAGGSFTTSQSVSITTATSGATIRYTTDGTTPTSSVGTIYTVPFDVTVTTTVKAIAYKASSTDSTVVSATFTKTSSGGGGSSSGGSSGGHNNPNPPTPSGPGLPFPSQSNSVSARLVNSNGVFYVIQNGVKKGVTSPGILNSCGFEFKNALTATAADLALPSGLLLPCDGALVKSNQDPTVYLLSTGKRYAFVSSGVFSGLGFKFTSVNVVTNPELQAVPQAANISDTSSSHLPGVDININGTIYWIDEAHVKHAYPSIEIYNSWHIDGNFSTIVPANAADLILVTGNVVPLRIVQ